MSFELRIIGKKGSKALKAIVEGTSIRRYVGKKYKVDALVNYGLAGKKLREYYSRFPSARYIPTINNSIGYSKIRAVKIARKNGILVPDSKVELDRSDKISDWIEKKFNSQGGIGICKATRRGILPNKYYQRFVKNRKYELRVHSFKWINRNNWSIQKRHGNNNEIAWNFNNGGYFSTVHDKSYPVFKDALDMSSVVLGALGMVFGAIDFIVDINNKVYFIEINSCPGFQELSKGIYIEAFNKLVSLGKKVMKYTN